MEWPRSLPKGLPTIGLLFALIVSACQSSGAPASESSSSGPPASPGIASGSPAAPRQTDEPEIPIVRPIVLGFSQLGSESDWRIANTESIRESAEEAGIELLFDNADQSQEKQVEAIRSFIRRKVDIIAVAPVVQDGWDGILKEAKAAGIPVIICDRSIDVADSSLYVSLIGADFYEEGSKAGKYLLDKMRDSPGEIAIAELKGTEGSSPSIERGKGFRDMISPYSNFAVIESEFADFTYEKGLTVMREMLKKRGSRIQVLFSHNDDMTLGAIKAIEEYGLVPGKDIVIVSVDGTNKAFEMLKAGRINCIVECNPLLGPNLMQAVTEVMEGRTIPKRIVPAESVFTTQTAKMETEARKY